MSCFSPHSSSALSKEEFMDSMMNLKIDYSKYERARCMMIAMIGLNCISENEQKEAIIAAMDHSPSLEVSTLPC